MNLFVAVSEESNVDDNNERIVYSEDYGVSWFNSNFSESTALWSSVVWSPELSIFVCVSGTAGSVTGRIQTSNNGKDWYQVSDTSVDDYVFNNVCWSSQLGLFVGCGEYNSNPSFFYSNNGNDWTKVETQSLSSSAWKRVLWSPKLGVFLAMSNSQMAYSNNGKNWYQVTHNFSGETLNSMIWSEEMGTFLALSSNSKVFLTSYASRVPTTNNVFDSSFNNIDNNGSWEIKARHIYNDNSDIVIETSNNKLVVQGNMQVQGITGATASFGYITGTTGTFDYINVTNLTATANQVNINSTNNDLSYNVVFTTNTDGGTGAKELYVDLTSITYNPSTGLLETDKIKTNGITGATASFGFLIGTTGQFEGIRTQGITGATASFRSLIGTTGQFEGIRTQGITGATASFGSLIGTTGQFEGIRTQGITGATASFGSIVGTTGAFSGTLSATVFTPSTGSGTNGIIFPQNPGGGSGDVASIKYYCVSGEKTVLEV